MNRLWKDVVSKLFDVIGPKNIVEIGSHKGINTRNILNYCLNHDANLIAIDPSPVFDPISFEDEFGDKFEFIQDLSLHRLPKLYDYDLILIDGDHNWYTVYNELKAIECNFDINNFPFILLHDVSWPYDRRDLYYNPDTIPPQYLHPYKLSGLVPGVDNLEDYGINNFLNNAIYYNTPCNGVLTAVEDFLKETNLDLAFYSINAFHGLGIICPNTSKNKENIMRVFYESNISGIMESFYLKEIIGKNAEIKRINGVNGSLEHRVSELVAVNGSLEDEVNSSINQNKVLKNEILDLSKSKMYLYDENKRLTEENDNIKSLNEKYLNELNALESKINSLNGEVKHYKDYSIHLKKRYDKLDCEKHSIINSNSWKMTAPLRKLKFYVKKFKH